MKSFKKIIPAIAMLALSAILATSTTYAWFSMNQTAQATGMSVTAKTNGSLIISVDSTPEEVGGKSTLALTSTNSGLYDCTSTAVSAGTPSADTATNLKTLKADARKNVDADSGNKKTGTFGEDDWAVVGSAGYTSTDYYEDFTIYLAAQGSAVEDQTLTAQLYAESGEQPYAAATTVDFYLNGTFVGRKTVSEGTALTLSSNLDIPQANTSGEGTTDGVKVTMRVYLDGDAKVSNEANANAVLNSNTYKSAATSFHVDFKIADIT